MVSPLFFYCIRLPPGWWRRSGFLLELIACPFDHAVAAGLPPPRRNPSGAHPCAHRRHEIDDVLDYASMTGAALSLELLDEAGQPYSAAVRKREYAELGLEFETY